MKETVTGMQRVAIGLGAVATTVLMTAAPASAHARVLRTTPGNGTTIDGRLKAVTVVFDEPVRIVPRSLVMTGATGAPQTIGAPRVIDGHVLQARLSDRLPAGRYYVGWRILSDDGHVESGNFGFMVAAAGGVSSSALAGFVPPAPAEPVWPVIVAAAMAAVACLGAALVVVRGLSAVRAAGGLVPSPDDLVEFSAASARAHTVSRH